MIERQAELNTIWENTPKYPTASVDIAVMPDLYKGLDRSGYETDNFQKEDYLFSTPFIVFDRNQLTQVLSTLEENGKLSHKYKGYTARMRSKVYEEIEVAISPSHRLTVEDFMSNPYLLSLLMGELDNYSYIYNAISVDRGNKEIVKKYRSSFIDCSPEKTKDLVFSLANRLTQLSSSIGFCFFGPDRKQNNHLNLIFEQPYIKGNEKPLYEATIISESALRVRDLETKLNDGKDYGQKAIDGINKGIEIHKNKIIKGESIYSPMFKVL